MIGGCRRKALAEPCPSPTSDRHVARFVAHRQYALLVSLCRGGRHSCHPAASSPPVILASAQHATPSQLRVVPGRGRCPAARRYRERGSSRATPSQSRRSRTVPFREHTARRRGSRRRCPPTAALVLCASEITIGRGMNAEERQGAFDELLHSLLDLHFGSNDSLPLLLQPQDRAWCVSGSHSLRHPVQKPARQWHGSQ